eukprot:TRINITY_DN33897_c0_g1_i1.p1 TRINITY_DN33897_c0_g1~~TRINITY_DN33897_c0_g1_i1.p1  ORF type:complete len:297 (+),score=34.43 TRINITY_DN33897_c0_g1_i1:103-993(+)
MAWLASDASRHSYDHADGWWQHQSTHAWLDSNWSGCDSSMGWSSGAYGYLQSDQAYAAWPASAWPRDDCVAWVAMDAHCHGGVVDATSSGVMIQLDSAVDSASKAAAKIGEASKHVAGKIMKPVSSAVPGQAALFIAVPEDLAEAVTSHGYRASKRGWVPASRSASSATEAFKKVHGNEVVNVLQVNFVPEGVKIEVRPDGVKICAEHLPAECFSSADDHKGLNWKLIDLTQRCSLDSVASWAWTRRAQFNVVNLQTAIDRISHMPEAAGTTDPRITQLVRQLFQALGQSSSLSSS